MWSVELFGHQRHLTGSAEPEVMQSRRPHFQWYLNPFLRRCSGQLADLSSSMRALFLIWFVRNAGACARHYVGWSSCRLMRFVAMCVACGHPLAPDPQSAICQRKMPFFLFNAASGEKSSFSLPRLLSGLACSPRAHIEKSPMNHLLLSHFDST